MSVINGNTTFGVARIGADFIMNSKLGEITMDNIRAGKDIDIFSDLGNVDVESAVAQRHLYITTTTGNIVIGRGQSVDGDLIMTTDIGDLIVKDELDVGNSSVLLTNEGGILLESISLNQNLTIMTDLGNIDIGNVDSESGDIKLLVQSAGDVLIENVAAGNDLDIETAFGSISARGKIESRFGNVNLIADGEGGINVHELLAKKDVKGLANNGEIILAKLNGKNVTLVINHGNNSIDVGQANVSGEFNLSAEAIRIEEAKHTNDSEYFNINLSGIGNSAMDNVVIGSAWSEKGVRVDGLWANNAFVHSDSEYFRLENAYIVDKGYLSNDRTTMTMYGKNPKLDNSDVQIYFVPTPQQSFARVSFQNEYADGREDYKILLNRDGVKRPFNQLNIMEEIGVESNRAKTTASEKGRIPNAVLDDLLQTLDVPGFDYSQDTSFDSIVSMQTSNYTSTDMQQLELDSGNIGQMSIQMADFDQTDVNHSSSSSSTGQADTQQGDAQQVETDAFDIEISLSDDDSDSGQDD